ncbi:hypothetical protein WJX74_003547 [Apatococcus lobatus]|uniref:Uncharacterized protein n=1 Tax=Apatococcus lobatus TaxID=904363 RepID=A0AAW1RVF7_9CHLO
MPFWQSASPESSLPSFRTVVLWTLERLQKLPLLESHDTADARRHPSAESSLGGSASLTSSSRDSGTTNSEACSISSSCPTSVLSQPVSATPQPLSDTTNPACTRILKHAEPGSPAKDFYLASKEFWRQATTLRQLLDCLDARAWALLEWKLPELRALADKAGVGPGTPADDVHIQDGSLRLLMQEREFLYAVAAKAVFLHDQLEDLALDLCRSGRYAFKDGKPYTNNILYATTTLLTLSPAWQPSKWRRALSMPPPAAYPTQLAASLPEFYKSAPAIISCKKTC